MGHGCKLTCSALINNFSNASHQYAWTTRRTAACKQPHPSIIDKKKKNYVINSRERELMLSTSSVKLQVLQELMSPEHPHKPVVQLPLLGGGSWLRPAAGWCAMAKGCVGRRPQAGFWPPGFCRPGGYEAMMMSFFFFFFVLLKSFPFFFQPPPAAAITSRLITTQIPQLPRNTNQPNSTQNKQNQSLVQNIFVFGFFWGCGGWIQLQEKIFKSQTPIFLLQI